MDLDLDGAPVDVASSGGSRAAAALPRIDQGNAFHEFNKTRKEDFTSDKTSFLLQKTS